MSGQRGKTDAADAAAIGEAVTRPRMRFVPIQEEHAQIILCLHRTRQGFVDERTATDNRLRGRIAEFGIVLPQKVTDLRCEIGAPLEGLPGYCKPCVGDRLAHANSMRIEEYDRLIAQAVRDDDRSKRLMTLSGIGPNTATPCSPASAVATHYPCTARVEVKRLDPRRESLMNSRGRSQSRLTTEAPARVFHQGPGDMPHMTGCRFAVRHLPDQRMQSMTNQRRKT